MKREKRRFFCLDIQGYMPPGAVQNITKSETNYMNKMYSNTARKQVNPTHETIVGWQNVSDD